MTTVGVATGAGRGMGLACAKRLSSMVDVLALVDRDPKTLDAAQKEVGGSAEVEAFLVDVTDGEALNRLAKRVSELGTLRAVAHAAGISPTMADWRQIFRVDLVGTAQLAEVLRPLAGAGSAMVCFASMAPELAISLGDPAVDAVLDNPLVPDFLERIEEALGPSIEDTGIAYSWAKRGVRRFVQSEAVRLGPVGARICSVSPGIIDTPQGRQEADTHQVMAELVKLTPLAREGQADEVAAVVAFLLSSEASYMTGTDVLVDGGVCAAVVGPSSGSRSSE